MGGTEEPVDLLARQPGRTPSNTLRRRFFQRLTADHETALCSSACFPSGEVSPQRLAIFLANTRTSALRLGACGPRHPYGAGAQPEKHASYFISSVPDCERLKQLLAAPDNAPSGSNEDQAIDAGYKDHRTPERWLGNTARAEKTQLP